MDNFKLSELAKNFYQGKEILITGGTGSLGSTIVHLLCQHCKPKGIRIYSRDELKQFNMVVQMAANKLYGNKLSYLIGDVRDITRLRRAMERVDVVIHTAAMKQVPACEDNPLEAIQTNVRGAENVINAALDCGVKKVMNVSTDKAVYPINFYGATKMTAENLFVHSNVYAQGGHATRFSSCRYGNVLASRGSVAQVFKEKAERGEVLPITHPDMTRFWITLPSVAQFLLNMIPEMKGGEIFVPAMKAMGIVDMAKAMVPNCETIYTGIRKGEKMHECLITREESRHATHLDGVYTIRPLEGKIAVYNSSRADFSFSSDEVPKLTPEELLEMLEE